MKREGKARPFIPCEVRAQTGPARATMPAVGCRRRRATTAVGTWRKRIHSSDDVYARATMHVHRRQRLCSCDDVCRVEGVVFHKHPKLQRSYDDVCIRATTPVSGRRRLPPVFMIKAGLARPNCEYDKKDLMKKLQSRKF